MTQDEMAQEIYVRRVAQFDFGTSEENKDALLADYYAKKLAALSRRLAEAFYDEGEES